MNRWWHATGRGLAAAGLAASAAYLGWRVATALSVIHRGAPVWLVLVSLLVELTGFAGSSLLVWALWRLPRSPGSMPGAVLEPRDVDVVVRVDDQPMHQVRATLLAIQSSAAGRTVLLDLAARPEIVTLAAEFDTLYAAPDIEDRNGLKTCGTVSVSPVLFLLDAGDVPAADAIPTLLPFMNDEAVAVVIAPSEMADDDSAEHGPNGVHELSFERARLNPSLGLRGAAIFAESGVLVRRAALDSVPPGDERPAEAETRWSVALMSQGWRLIAPPIRPLIVRPVIDSPELIYERRVAQARGAWRSLVARDGVLRTGGLRLGQRLSVTAAAVRPLSGLRRLGFIATVVGCLLSGTLPLRPDVIVLATLWAQSWLWTSLGLAMMSELTLRPGDRTRASLRSLGASWQGLRHPMAFERRRAPVMTPHPLQHGGALVGAVVVLSAVIMMRGMSEQWTHALGAMPYRQLAGLVAVALWLLVMSLDVLRMMGRRSQLRRATRLVTRIPAELDGRPVSVFDIAPLGAGFESSTEMVTGQRATMQATITTRRGCTDVTLPVVVRNINPVTEDRWRVGVEFAGASARALNPLVELCVVEPARRRLGEHRPATAPDAVVALTDATPVAAGRRLPLRLIALLAVLGAIATAQPGDGTPLAWIVSSVSILIAAGVMAGSARPRHPQPAADQSTSSPSPSPDLAIR